MFSDSCSLHPSCSGMGVSGSSVGFGAGTGLSSPKLRMESLGVTFSSFIKCFKSHTITPQRCACDSHLSPKHFWLVLERKSLVPRKQRLLLLERFAKWWNTSANFRSSSHILPPNRYSRASSLKLFPSLFSPPCLPSSLLSCCPSHCRSFLLHVSCHGR